MALFSLFDEGFRKVIVAVVATAAVVVLNVINIPPDHYDQSMKALEWIVTFFIGGNALEHFKNLILESKRMKIQNGNTEVKQ